MLPEQALDLATLFVTTQKTSTYFIIHRACLDTKMCGSKRNVMLKRFLYIPAESNVNPYVFIT